jgi:hypothetical protein
MVDPELLLDAGRQRHEARLRYASEYRMARLVKTARLSPWTRVRWALADGLIAVGQKLAREYPS